MKDSNYNDIALVELEKEVDYVTSISHVRPACLYYDEVDYNPVPNTIGIVGELVNCEYDYQSNIEQFIF